MKVRSLKRDEYAVYYQSNFDLLHLHLENQLVASLLVPSIYDLSIGGCEVRNF